MSEVFEMTRISRGYKKLPAVVKANSSIARKK